MMLGFVVLAVLRGQFNVDRQDNPQGNPSNPRSGFVASFSFSVAFSMLCAYRSANAALPGGEAPARPLAHLNGRAALAGRRRYG